MFQVYHDVLLVDRRFLFGKISNGPLGWLLAILEFNGKILQALGGKRLGLSAKKTSSGPSDLVWLVSSPESMAARPTVGTQRSTTVTALSFALLACMLV